MKLPPVVFERLTATLVAFTRSESATEPVATVSVVDGEVSEIVPAVVNVSGAAWAARSGNPSAIAAPDTNANMRTEECFIFEGSGVQEECFVVLIIKAHSAIRGRPRARNKQKPNGAGLFRATHLLL